MRDPFSEIPSARSPQRLPVKLKHMTQHDLLFLVLIGIGLAALTLITLRLLRPPKRDERGEWYEGPWEDDDRPQGHNRRPRS